MLLLVLILQGLYQVGFSVFIRIDKVVLPVCCLLLDARHISSEELSVSSALYVIKGGADHRCVVHFFLSLATPLNKKDQELTAESLITFISLRKIIKLTPTQP